MTRITLSSIILVLVSSGQLLAQGSAEDLAKLKARIEKLEADNAALKKELAQLRAKLESLGKKLDPSVATPSAPEAALKEFFSDLHRGRNASAYATMSVAYRKQTDRAAFDTFIEKNPVLRNNLNAFFHQGACKFRKLANDKTFECDFIGQAILDDRPFVNIVLRVVEDDGAWKIDDFVEIKDFRKKNK
jgi:hypothetical protein